MEIDEPERALLNGEANRKWTKFDDKDGLFLGHYIININYIGCYKINN